MRTILPEKIWNFASSNMKGRKEFKIQNSKLFIREFIKIKDLKDLRENSHLSHLSHFSHFSHSSTEAQQTSPPLRGPSPNLGEGKG